MMSHDDMVDLQVRLYVTGDGPSSVAAFPGLEDAS